MHDVKKDLQDISYTAQLILRGAGRYEAANMLDNAAITLQEEEGPPDSVETYLHLNVELAPEVFGQLSEAGEGDMSMHIRGAFQAVLRRFGSPQVLGPTFYPALARKPTKDELEAEGLENGRQAHEDMMCRMETDRQLSQLMAQQART
jgi:hypothetical protein